MSLGHIFCKNYFEKKWEKLVLKIFLGSTVLVQYFTEAWRDSATWVWTFFDNVYTEEITLRENNLEQCHFEVYSKFQNCGESPILYDKSHLQKLSCHQNFVEYLKKLYESSYFFHLTLVTHSDRTTGGKELKNFLNCQRSSLF